MRLRLELGNHVLNLSLLITRRVSVLHCIIRVPPLVALVITLQLREVKLKTVERLGSLLSKVRLHAEIEARLQADLGSLLIVIEIFVEVGDRSVI